LRITRALVVGGIVLVLAAAVAALSCRVYSGAYVDARVGADYSVRGYQVRTPSRIVGETMRTGSHGGGAEPAEHETWLVQGESRVARVSDRVGHPAAAREDGRFYAYLAPTDRPLLRVVRVSDGRTREYEVPRWAPVFWEGADVVRLVERDRGVTITFLHEIRLEPAFLSGR
jgi:hypothetical protein